MFSLKIIYSSENESEFLGYNLIEERGDVAKKLPGVERP